jgi:hypothetical protein
MTFFRFGYDNVIGLPRINRPEKTFWFMIHPGSKICGLLIFQIDLQAKLIMKIDL